MIFKIGERVRITYKETTLDGEIFLACSTGLSVTLTFNGFLESYAGLMPTLWVNDQYIDLLHGQPLKIIRLGQVIPWPDSGKAAAATRN